MPLLKQTFSWGAFASAHTRLHGGVADPDALLAAAARIGYAGVEMPPESVWSLVRAQGMVVATIVGHQSLSEGMNRRENHGRIVGEIAANLEKAVANGIPNLIVFSGNRGGLSDEEGAAVTVEILRRVAPLAEAAEVTLLLELLNSRVDHRDYQADRTEWGVRVCAAVGSPRVKLLYDIYHMQIMEGDVIATLRRHRDQIGHFHTAGVPGRRDLDDAQELNYPAIAQAIADTGFDGYLGHEFTPKGEPLAALEAAYRLCAVSARPAP